jgi:DNA polymerase IIIc chi subunit
MNDGGKIVLAGCPGSGKTEMAIFIIKKFLDLGKRVLVLAHSTNVLKDNFQSRWNTYFADNDNLTITIPQSYKGGEYDLLIVDEAHENYLSRTGQAIAKSIDRHLLLTGTPSKFVGNMDLEVIAMSDIPVDFFAKTAVDIIESDYSWTEKDFNHTGSLKSTASITKRDTVSSLNKVLSALMNDTKTLIACNTKKQADFVNGHLNKLGYKSVVSHSDSDKDSELFEAFKNNEYAVLVVVNRGRIGYSDNDLMNIIDMTGTKNPDLIYQMFARCVRGDQSQQKRFIKLVTNDKISALIAEISTNMALSLMFRDVVSTYNGKNMNSFKLPVKRQMSNTRTGAGSTISFPKYENAIVELTKIQKDLSDGVSLYSHDEISDLLIEYTDSKPRIDYESINAENVREWCSKFKNRRQIWDHSQSRAKFITDNFGDILDELYGPISPRRAKFDIESEADAIKVLEWIKSKGLKRGDIRYHINIKTYDIIKKDYADLLNEYIPKTSRYSKKTA